MNTEGQCTSEATTRLSMFRQRLGNLGTRRVPEPTEIVDVNESRRDIQ
jgi:hypothetical protein